MTAKLHTETCVFLKASFTVLEEEGPHIRPLPFSCPSLLRQHPPPTRRVGQEVESLRFGSGEGRGGWVSSSILPLCSPPGESEALAAPGLKSWGSGVHSGWVPLAWVVGSQQLQLSFDSVTLGCQDTSLSMLLPVLDLAISAGRWACEDSSVCGGI